MPNSTWKKVEGEIAKFFRSTRTPLSGGNSKHTRSDSLHPKLFLEAKYRQKHAHHSVLSKAEELAEKEDKIPVLVTKHHRQIGFNVTVHNTRLVEFCIEFLRDRGFKVTRIK